MVPKFALIWSSNNFLSLQFFYRTFFYDLTPIHIDIEQKNTQNTTKTTNKMLFYSVKCVNKQKMYVYCKLLLIYNFFFCIYQSQIFINLSIFYCNIFVNNDFSVVTCIN